jgi:hypothetical protein
VKIALDLCAEHNMQNFTSNVQKLVQKILFDDEERTQFYTEIKTIKQDTFVVSKPLDQTSTYKDTLTKNSAKQEKGYIDDDAAAHSSVDDPKKFEYNITSGKDDLANFELVDVNAYLALKDSLSRIDQSKNIQLDDSQILFRTQQDGHSLFAAISQVLYQYTAAYAADNEYTEDGDKNVHYRKSQSHKVTDTSLLKVRYFASTDVNNINEL